MKKIFFVLLILFLITPFYPAHGDTLYRSIDLSMWGEGMVAADFLFDPTLGTLTSVELGIDFSVQVSYSTWDPEPWGSYNGSLETFTQIHLWEDNSARMLYEDPYAQGSGWVETITDDPTGWGETYFYQIITPFSFADFILQTGDTYVVAQADPSIIMPESFFDDLGNEYYVDMPEVWGQINVTYEYTTVPIPPAILLLSSGCIGILAFRRRTGR